MKQKNNFRRRTLVLMTSLIFVAGAFIPVVGMPVASPFLQSFRQPLQPIVADPEESKASSDIERSSNLKSNDFLEGNQPGPLNVNDPWWNANWSYRKEITIDYTKVTALLANFPVLISFSSDADLASKAQSDGDDLVFTDKNGNKLNHEIEMYTSSTGNLVAWVNIPQLSSTSNTILYMYYGNGLCGSQRNVGGTWNSQFRIVQHLEETSGTYYDSTTYYNNGTNYGSTHTSGYIDGGNSFDGTNDYIDCGSKSSLDITNAVTIEAWVKRTGVGFGTYPGIVSRAQSTGFNRYQLRYKTTTKTGVQFFVGNSTKYGVANSSANLPLNTWTHVVGTYNGSKVSLFVNGVHQNSTTFTGSPNVASQILEIGRYTTSNYFSGYIDEVRVSNTARNSSWISTEYNNQHDPSSFYSVGTEEGRPNEPLLSNESPKNGSVGVVLCPVLSVHAVDCQGDSMNVFFRTNESGTWKTIGSNLSVGNGTFYCGNTSAMNKYLTTYHWSVNCSDGATWVNRTYSYKTEIGPVTNPFAQSWQYRKKITINHLKMAADLTNFPILIKLIDSDLRDKAQADGDDILFMDGDGVAALLPHEIEYYNSADGTLVAWVKAPGLSSSVDTVLYLYYGNPDVPAMQNKSGVWDAGYKMVQHLGNTSGVYADSTIYHNDGTNYGSTHTSGYIDGGNNFDGTNDYIDCGNKSSLDITNAVTIEAWVKRTGAGLGSFPGIVTRASSTDYNRYQLRYNPGATSVQFFLGDTSSYKVVKSNADLPLNVWTHVVGTWGGSTMLLFVNGVQQTNTDTFTSSPNVASQILEIGRFTNLNYFSGYIDEVRVSDSARSSSWVSTEYDNQYDPGSFYSVGTEEGRPASPALSNESPKNSSVGVVIYPVFSVYAVDYQGDSMNVFFRTNASGTWRTIGSNLSVGNGTFYCGNTSAMNKYLTTYHWSVNVTDPLGSGSWTNHTYHFTTRAKDYLHMFTINHTSHIDYGCSYPVTYIFNIPPEATNLKAYKYVDTWTLQANKSDSDVYSGIEGARFNYTEHKAYISTSFLADSDSVVIKITDSTNNSIVATYVGIAPYYDNSKVAVVLSVDDWYARYHEYFMTAIDRCQARNIWITPGIVTVGSAVYGGEPANRTDMQQQIDEGFVEPASHSKYHLNLPYDQEQYGIQSSYDEEIGGSKQDLIDELTFPSLNRRGDQDYLYAWIEPGGEFDSTVQQKLGEYDYLCDRSTGSSNSFAIWNAANGVYERVGYSIDIESVRDLTTLNNAFSGVYSSGGIYHMFGHARNNDFISGDVALHLNYISNRSDIWYVGFGQLYLYHYMQERNVIQHTISIGNLLPHLSAESPADRSTEVSIGRIPLQVRTDDINGDLMNIWFMTNASGIWQPIGSNMSVPSGVYQQSYLFSNYNIVYWWSVNCSDATGWTNKTYRFTTRPENYPPVLSNPLPSEKAVDVAVGGVTLSITVNDLDGNLMNIIFRTNASGIWSTIGANNSQPNGTYEQGYTFDKLNHLYYWGVNCSDGKAWVNRTYYFTTEKQTVLNPFASGWQYRKNITIDHTKVPCNLSNFPVLIKLTDNDLYEKAQPDGNDIIFMDGDGIAALLPHEIEYYNFANGTLIAWVNVTSLSSTVDTMLYMYYGNPDVEAMENKSGVWDAGYKMVQHLGNTSGVYADSTMYDNDGTNYGSTHTSGYIDGGNSFNGTNDYIDCGNKNSLDITNAVTIEAWVKRTGDGTSNYPGIVSRAQTTGYNRYQLRYNPGSNVVQFFLGNSSYDVVNSNADLPLNVWTHVVGSWNGSTMLLFVNGVQQTDTGTFTGSPNVASQILEIGRYTTSNYFSGYIDEVKVSNINRSICWISTEYNNQHNPDTFYSVGAEEEQISEKEYIVALRGSWNLVSLPFNESKAKTTIKVRNNSIEYTWDEAVSNHIVLNSIYNWDTTSYGISDSLVPEQGYWMWAYYDCDLILTSSKIEDTQLSDLQSGWNIIGLPVNTSVAKSSLLVNFSGSEYTWEEATTGPDPIILGFVYGWERSDQMYMLSDTFEPGDGYWMYAYHACRLNREEG